MTTQDFDRSYKKKIDDFRGFVCLEKSESINLNRYQKVEKAKFSDEDFKYLNKIIELSKTENFDLVFYYAPFEASETIFSNIAAVEEIARENDIVIINGFELIDILKLDETSDFYDTGHFNYKGAEKFSEYLSTYFQLYFDISYKNENYAF